MLTAAPRKEAAETVIPTLQPLTPRDTTWETALGLGLASCNSVLDSLWDCGPESNQG